MGREGGGYGQWQVHVDGGCGEWRRGKIKRRVESRSKVVVQLKWQSSHTTRQSQIKLATH